MNDLISFLFKTNALRVCPKDKPFWYTSGKIGPYFINTHFLYGNESQANELLEFINKGLTDKLTLPKKIFQKVLYQYENNKIYNTIINTLKEYIETNIDTNSFDYISGGERRDWFFSNILAYLLKKPHISIFKDLSTVINDYSFENTYTTNDLNGKNVLHIADLITEASSYIRAWIPAIQNINGNISYSTVVVDRMQGGSKKLESNKIKSFCLIKIEPSLFKKALEKEIISDSQYDIIIKFLENPDNSMRDFLISHPEFITESLNSDEKTAKRAQLCIESNLYNL